MTDPAPPEETRPPVPRRKRKRFLLLHGAAYAVWTMGVLVTVLIVAGIYFIYERPLVAPDWIEARIEARLAEDLPQARVTFGELRLLVKEGWRPQIRLRDVSVRTLGGEEIVRFSESKAKFSMSALLGGRIAPSEITMTGVFATLLRESDGSFALQSEFSSAGGLRFETPGDAVDQIDALLSQPGLSGLDRAELRGLTLQFIDRRVQRAFTLDGGRLIATRNGDTLSVDADLALLGEGPGVTTLAANFNSVIGTPEAQFGVTLDNMSAADIALQSPAFGWLGVLRAPISGAVRAGVRPDGTLAPLYATLQIAKGSVQPTDQTRPIPFDAARSYFSYDPAEGVLRFDELSVQSPWITARAEGTATLTGLSAGTLEQLVGQFDITELSANPADLYPQPVKLDRASMDFSLRLSPFVLELGRLEITDQGRTSRAMGKLSAEPEGWKLALDARAESIGYDRILDLWPEQVKLKTRKWLGENLTGGRISDADFALRLLPGEAPRSFLSFGFEDATVKALKTLPPITQAQGRGSLDANRFVISLDAGRMTTPEGGVLTIDRTAFIIPDTTVKDGAPAVVRLNVRSDVTPALWALDQPPMQVMRRAGLPVALADGQVDMAGTLAFPLRRGGDPKDVVFDATAVITDVQSDTLIKGRALRSPRLAVTANNEGVEIAGAGTLDGVSFDASWRQPIGAGSTKSTLSATATLSPRALDAFDVALPSGTVSGTAEAQISIALEKGQPPRMSLRSDLRGLALNVPQLGWRKAAATAGTLDLDVILGATPTVPRLSLAAAGLDAQGSVTLAANGGGLERLRLDRLRLGGWLDVPVDLIGRGAGRTPQVAIRGGTLDLRRAQFGSGGGASGPAGPPIEVQLDRLQISETIWVSALSGTFSTQGGLSGPFQAQLNGGTAIRGTVVPRNGRSAVRVLSQDAGGLLRSAGVLQQAVGGALDLTLVPVGSGGAFDGRLKIDGLSVKDAPAMAALVNAISVVGLVNEMNGDGIYFTEVEAAFRLTPNRMTLTSASAVGASLGLSMDGVYATDTGQIAMQGVITPVYLLNGIGSLLTRKGEGLIGFNYALRGDAKSPDVSVNPLSALMPGGLRDIFRAPPTELPQVDGGTGDARTPAEKASPSPVVRGFEGR